MNDQNGNALGWVVSYPKSGNTWIRLVCAAYATKDQNVEHFVRFDDVNPFHYQACTPIPIQQLSIAQEVQIRPAAMLVLAHEMGGPGPSLIKSHHAHCRIEGIALWQKPWVAKVVYPIRDPREVCCSAAHHFGMSYEEMADFMNQDMAHIGDDDSMTHILGSWSRHVESWLEVDERYPVLPVRYEDMHAEPYDTFAEIIDFIGVPELDRELLEWAVDINEFDNLQEKEDEIGFPEKSDHQDRFFRSGQTDGWRDELPSDVARKIEDDHGEIMERLGYL